MEDKHEIEIYCGCREANMVTDTGYASFDDMDRKFDFC